MDAAIRFSQTSLPGQDEQHFLKVDVTGRTLEICNIKGRIKGQLKYDLAYSSTKLQPFRAFDWHPSEVTLIAVGQTGGEASLIDLSAENQTVASFPVRSQRSCNAVGLNTKNYIAIGLDKVRNDVCLNVWDVNQRIGDTKAPHRGVNDPLFKLATGDPITSLRFFQDQPSLLAAGVKGQYIRIYDLREAPSVSTLQFQTRCVNNIALDTQDENYLASAQLKSNPTVSIWDRRMFSRTSVTQVGFGSYISSADRPPEVSVEMKDVIDPQNEIWGLRFSKTKRGLLGVLSSTGQLRMLQFLSSDNQQSEGQQDKACNQQLPQNISLENGYNFSNAWNERPVGDEVGRIVSFDFTTSTSKSGAPKIVTLSGDGIIDRKTLPKYHPEVYNQFRRHISHVVRNPSQPSEENAEIPAAFEKLSASANMLSKTKLRAQAGYRLNATRNLSVVQADPALSAFWSWIEHATAVAEDQNMVFDSLDLSFLGVFGFWMEEIHPTNRLTRKFPFSSQIDIGASFRDLARRLNLTRGRGCHTEYPHNRVLSLYILGLPWTHDDIEHECDELMTSNQHTKAAALALFAGEMKLALKALRTKDSKESHKLLAIALMGSKSRQEQRRSGNRIYGRSGEEEEDQENEGWEELINSIVADLTDPYSKAILANVRSGSWEDVTKVLDLPLNYRIMVALRHLDDSRLTKYLSTLKNEVVASGDLEGIVLTGLGTAESVHLLQSHTGHSSDTQTAALGMSYAVASDRFLSPKSPEARLVHSFREAYRQQLLSLDLKIEKTHFLVAIAELKRKYNVTEQIRPKEQIKLVCTYCTKALSQFGHDQQVNSNTIHMTDTLKNPLSPEKAAAIGVVCPNCGRHLPRCGVCDLWLGTPDESFSKWYKPPEPRGSNSLDLSASMVGSTITAIGPSSTTPSVAITGPRGSLTGIKKLTTSDLPAEVIEVVDGDLVNRERERKWYEAMHKFTVMCMKCGHGFHAEHARQWFDGVDGRAGHNICPIPSCQCLCNG